ncbi:TenA family protein [Halomonas halmophila]|uniref:Aminopyrimidine aminohydrolase n=1 Tax=Halomonas halmophila TaxID=252 RepID=A0A4Y4EWQ4_9GAMM|nr:TenA family protein [Halomonas halmophila]GED22362.1 aminopyrimidine aminohydrolase [Halomonas halmophila]
MSSIAEWTQWAERQASPRLTEWLRELSEPDWSRTVHHPLFDALAARRLTDQEFAAYMVQDYGFVDPFTALLGQAIGHAPCMQDRVVLGQFMGMLTSDENSTFQRTFEAYGVSAEAEYLPATRDFRQLLKDTALHQEGARSTRYAEMLAVLVVTEWLYLEWATRVERAEGLQPLMEEWIDLHDNPEFRTFVAWLRRRLEEEMSRLEDEAFVGVVKRFRETVACERAFHDAVYHAD